MWVQNKVTKRAKPSSDTASWSDKESFEPLLTVNWSPTYSSVVRMLILFFNRWLKVLDNLPTSTSMTISLVQLQIPSAWFSEDFTMAVRHSLPSLFYSWFHVYIGIPHHLFCSVWEEGLSARFTMCVQTYYSVMTLSLTSHPTVM